MEYYDSISRQEKIIEKWKMFILHRKNMENEKTLYLFI